MKNEPVYNFTQEHLRRIREIYPDAKLFRVPHPQIQYIQAQAIPVDTVTVYVGQLHKGKFVVYTGITKNRHFSDFELVLKILQKDKNALIKNYYDLSLFKNVFVERLKEAGFKIVSSPSPLVVVLGFEQFDSFMMPNQNTEFIRLEYSEPKINLHLTKSSFAEVYMGMNGDLVPDFVLEGYTAENVDKAVELVLEHSKWAPKRKN